MRVGKAMLFGLLRLALRDRVIGLDYPYRPRHRRWDPSISRIFAIIDGGRDRYGTLLAEIAAFRPFFERIAVKGGGKDDPSPCWLNGWISALDALTLYGILALRNPRSYVEIGSGNSTKFARRAIQDHGLRTAIVSIDPYPRAGIDALCDEVIRKPCEDVPIELFASLSAEDVVFVDSSHRSFASSDVTVFFTEIQERLPRGLIYGLHDIFLPYDYPEEWKDRFYNEQYLLAAYLLGGAGGDEIILPNAYLSAHDQRLLEPLSGVFGSAKLAGIERHGCAFWMRRA